MAITVWYLAIARMISLSVIRLRAAAVDMGTQVCI